MPTAVGERTAGGGQDPVACDEPGRPVLRRSTRSCCPRTRISRSLVPSSARGGPADGSAGRRSTQRSKSIDGLRNACSRREPEFPRPTGCWCYRIDAILPRQGSRRPAAVDRDWPRDVVDRAGRRRRRRRGAERRRHYWMPVRWRASCRSWQACRATIRPSRTVNTS